MWKILVILVSIGLASYGTICFLLYSNHNYLRFLKKIKGYNIFSFWLFVSNIFFYIYFMFSSLAYNSIIVKSKYAEAVTGSAGGYFVPEDVALKYFEIENVVFVLTLFLNISIFLFFLYGYLYKNRYRTQRQNIKNNINWILSLILFLISLSASLLSLILLVIIDGFSVSYGG